MGKVDFHTQPCSSRINVNERRSKLELHFPVCLRSWTQRPLGIRHHRLLVLMYCLIPFSGISGACSTYFFGLALTKCHFNIMPWGFRSLHQWAGVKTPLPSALEISYLTPTWNPLSLTSSHSSCSPTPPPGRTCILLNPIPWNIRLLNYHELACYFMEEHYGTTVEVQGIVYSDQWLVPAHNNDV